MSKVVPLLIGGTGLAAASYGGYVLFKGKGAAGEGKQVEDASTNLTPQSGGGAGTDVGTPKQKNTQSEVKFQFDSVEEFKKKAKDSECIKTDFGNDFSISGGEDLSENKKPDGKSSFFKTGSEETKSCLIVNWTKDSKDSKGTGKFTWLWTFSKGSEGFISFNVAEPSSDAGKLKFTGAFYLVEKGDQDKGSIKYKKELTNGDQKVDEKTLDEYFPKAGTDLKASVGGDYWGFVDTKDKIKELCKSGSTDCQNNQPETKKFQWKAKTEDTKTLKDWTSGLGGWEKIFDVKKYGDLETQIKDFKGTWSSQPQ